MRNKILHILPFSSGGGAEKIQKLIYKELDKYIQYEFIISELKTYKNLYKFIFHNKNPNERYIIGWLYYGGLAAILLDFFVPNKKVIISLHSRVNKKLEGFPIKIIRILISLLINSSKSKIIFPNKFAMEDHIRKGYKRKSLKVIHNGILLEKDFENIKTFKHKDIQDSQKFIIGFIGRNDRYKNLDLFINVFEEIIEMNLKKINFIMKGKGLEKLNEKISTEKKPFIKIESYTKNINDFFDRIDLLLLTSKSECSPLVVTEAIFRGVRVVSTPTGDVKRLIGQHGRISKTFKKSSIIEAIVKEINYKKNNFIDESYYSRMRNHALLTSDFSKMKKEFINLLD